jgi:hypothetical protein
MQVSQEIAQEIEFLKAENDALRSELQALLHWKSLTENREAILDQFEARGYEFNRDQVRFKFNPARTEIILNDEVTLV